MASKKIWGTITLSPGASTTWWHTWGFTENHWVRFDACPSSDNSKVEVTRQWAEKDLYGNVRILVRFKNIGSTTVLFRRTCLKE